jgi:hypothetical protein
LCSNVSELLLLACVLAKGIHYCQLLPRPRFNCLNALRFTEQEQKRNGICEFIVQLRRTLIHLKNFCSSRARSCELGISRSDPVALATLHRHAAHKQVDASLNNKSRNILFLDDRWIYLKYGKNSRIYPIIFSVSVSYNKCSNSVGFCRKYF